MPTLQRLSSQEEIEPLPRRDGRSKRKRDDDHGGGSNIGSGAERLQVCDSNDNQGIAKRAKTEQNKEKENESGKQVQACGAAVAGGSVNASNGSANVQQQQCDPRQCATKNVNTKVQAGGKKKRKKDPNAPKHPTSSYMIFSNVIRPKLKAQGLPCSGAALGERWRALSNVEKRPYSDMAARDLERYSREMAVYRPPCIYSAMVNSTEPGNPAASGAAAGNNAKALAGNTKSTSKKKKKRKDPNAPKGVSGVFVYYQNEMRSKVIAGNPKATLKDVAITMGQQWRSLSDHEKRPYFDLWEEDKRRYEREMVVYNDAKRLHSSAGDKGNIGSLHEAGKVVDDERAAEQKGAECESPPFQYAVTVAILPEMDENDKLLVSHAESIVIKRANIENEKAASVGMAENDMNASTKKPIHAEGETCLVATKDDEEITSTTKKSASKMTSTKRTKIGDNKENQANASSKDNGNGFAQNERKQSSKFGCLGKRIKAMNIKSGRSLAKNNATKQSYLSPTKATNATASSKIMADLESMKASVKKLPQIMEKKAKVMAEARKDECDDNGSIGSSSSSDSIWEAGMMFSPRKHDERRDAVKGDGSPKDQKKQSIINDPDFEVSDLNDRNIEDTEVARLKCGYKEEEEEEEEALEVALPAQNRVQITSACDSECADACCHGEETQQTTNTSKRQLEVQPAAKATDTTATVTRTTKLRLVPISQNACDLVLREKGLTFSDPDYLVAGSEEYAVARDIITLERTWSKGADGMKESVASRSSRFPIQATLGRNKTTKIQWSAISRKLCDVFLAIGSPTNSNAFAAAYLSITKSPNEHAICLDGRELNEPIGKRIQLKDGNVVSLYGPTGFAYRVELAHFDMKPNREFCNQK